ncbi:MAG: hypothetical protein Q8N17_26225 [Burkholderiaceae bacterium]|nr:hypothetical protein [Burkholderiaceae bacterium]
MSTKIEPGSELHLTLLMAPYHLNLVVGEDRMKLLLYAQSVWHAAAASHPALNGLPDGALMGGWTYEGYRAAAAATEIERDALRFALKCLVRDMPSYADDTVSMKRARALLEKPA